MMKKIGIVITDGVGYRNFVLSEFLNEISGSTQKMVLCVGPRAEWIFGMNASFSCDAQDTVRK